MNHLTDAEAARADRLAAALRALAPTVTTVRLTPVWTDAGGAPGLRTLVQLLDDDRRPVGADGTTHRAARTAIRAAYPGADWAAGSYTYDVSAGCLVLDAPPTAPVDLFGIGTC